MLEKIIYTPISPEEYEHREREFEDNLWVAIEKAKGRKIERVPFSKHGELMQKFGGDVYLREIDSKTLEQFASLPGGQREIFPHDVRYGEGLYGVRYFAIKTKEGWFCFSKGESGRVRLKEAPRDENDRGFYGQNIGNQLFQAAEKGVFGQPEKMIYSTTYEHSFASGKSGGGRFDEKIDSEIPRIYVVEQEEPTRRGSYVAWPEKESSHSEIKSKE